MSAEEQTVRAREDEFMRQIVGLGTHTIAWQFNDNYMDDRGQLVPLQSTCLDPSRYSSSTSTPSSQIHTNSSQHTLDSGSPIVIDSDDEEHTDSTTTNSNTTTERTNTSTNINNINGTDWRKQPLHRILAQGMESEKRSDYRKAIEYYRWILEADSTNTFVLQHLKSCYVSMTINSEMEDEDVEEIEEVMML